MLKRLAVAVLFASLLPSYGQQSPSKQATCVIKQEGTTIECSLAETKPEAYFKRLFSPDNVANIGLVFVGLLGIIAATFTLLAIGKQAKLMEGQLEEMQKASEIGTKTLILQYRPRIIVRDVRAKSFSKEISEGVIGISKPVRCAMSLQIVNSGGSPAHIVEGDIYLISARRGHHAEEAEAEVKESTHMGIGERTLQPGQWEIIEFGLDTRIPNDARWVEFHKGVSSHSIVLLGTIWYRDELGIPRKTGLHREYDPKTQVFVRRKDSEEEYSD